MKKLILISFIIVSAPNLVFAADSLHESTEGLSDPNKVVDDAPDRPGLVDYVNRYEFGLDIRQTQILDENALMLQAQWNKRYWWGTWLGLGAGATAESISSPVDQGKLKTTMYYLGLNLEQAIFRYSTWLKAHAGVFLGMGKLYSRFEADAGGQEFNDLNVTVVEPFIVVTFFNRWGAEFGANFAIRGVTGSEKEIIPGFEFDEKDYSSVAMGLTVRRGL